MSQFLLASAQARSQQCRRDVLHAIKIMERAGDRISLKGVAARAGVSRNFIYTTPDVHAELKVARERQGPRSTPPRVSAVPTSDDSLRTRLTAALDENRRLRDKVEALQRDNEILVNQVVTLQNPAPANVAPLRRRRG